MSHAIPTAIKIRNGNPGKRPLNTNEPTPALGRPACPAHITGEALAEWERITDELEQMGLLTTADRTVIALYCQTWARWIEAETKVKELGLMVSAPKTKTPMHNPYLSMANTAHGQIVKLLAELGLTPAARSKIHVEKSGTKDDDDFSEIRR